MKEEQSKRATASRCASLGKAVATCQRRANAQARLKAEVAELPDVVVATSRTRPCTCLHGCTVVLQTSCEPGLAQLFSTRSLDSMQHAFKDVNICVYARVGTSHLSSWRLRATAHVWPRMMSLHAMHAFPLRQLLKMDDSPVKRLLQRTTLHST